MAHCVNVCILSCELLGPNLPSQPEDEDSQVLARDIRDTDVGGDYLCLTLRPGSWESWV